MNTQKLQGASHDQGGVHIEAEGGERIFSKEDTSKIEKLASQNKFQQLGAFIKKSMKIQDNRPLDYKGMAKGGGKIFDKLDNKLPFNLTEREHDILNQYAVYNNTVTPEMLNSNIARTIMAKEGVKASNDENNEWIKKIFKTENISGNLFGGPMWTEGGTEMSKTEGNGRWGGYNILKKEEYDELMALKGEERMNKAVEFYKRDFLNKDHKGFKLADVPIEARKRLGDYIYNSNRKIQDVLLQASKKISVTQANSKKDWTSLWNTHKEDILTKLNDASDLDFLNEIDLSIHDIQKGTWDTKRKNDPSLPDVFANSTSKRAFMPLQGTKIPSIPSTLIQSNPNNASLKNNNPGNIMYYTKDKSGKLSTTPSGYAKYLMNQGYSISAGSSNKDGQFIKFNSVDDGLNAKLGFWGYMKTKPIYKGKTLDEALMLYSGNGYDAKALGLDQYSGTTIDKIPDNVWNEVSANQLKREDNVMYSHIFGSTAPNKINFSNFSTQKAKFEPTEYIDPWGTAKADIEVPEGEKPIEPSLLHSPIPQKRKNKLEDFVGIGKYREGITQEEKGFSDEETEKFFKEKTDVFNMIDFKKNEKIVDEAFGKALKKLSRNPWMRTTIYDEEGKALSDEQVMKLLVDETKENLKKNIRLNKGVIEEIDNIDFIADALINKKIQSLPKDPDALFKKYNIKTSGIEDLHIEDAWEDLEREKYITNSFSEDFKDFSYSKVSPKGNLNKPGYWYDDKSGSGYEEYDSGEFKDLTLDDVDKKIKQLDKKESEIQETFRKKSTIGKVAAYATGKAEIRGEGDKAQGYVKTDHYRKRTRLEKMRDALTSGYSYSGEMSGTHPGKFIKDPTQVQPGQEVQLGEQVFGLSPEEQEAEFNLQQQQEQEKQQQQIAANKRKELESQIAEYDPETATTTPATTTPGGATTTYEDFFNDERTRKEKAKDFLLDNAINIAEVIGGVAGAGKNLPRFMISNELIQQARNINQRAQTGFTAEEKTSMIRDAVDKEHAAYNFLGKSGLSSGQILGIAPKLQEQTQKQKLQIDMLDQKTKEQYEAKAANMERYLSDLEYKTQFLPDYQEAQMSKEAASMTAQAGLQGMQESMLFEKQFGKGTPYAAYQEAMMRNIIGDIRAKEQSEAKYIADANKLDAQERMKKKLEGMTDEEIAEIDIEALTQ